MMKIRATAEIGDVIAAARYTGPEPAGNHPEWKDGKDVVDGFDVTIKMGDLVADYHLTVGNRREGWKEIYDLRIKRQSTDAEHAGRADVTNSFGPSTAYSASK